MHNAYELVSHTDGKQITGYTEKTDFVAFAAKDNELDLRVRPKGAPKIFFGGN